MEDPARVALQPPDADLVVDYPAPWWFAEPGRCRLRIWHAEKVALVTELDGNPGPSITNAAEQVTAAVLDVLDGLPYTIVEHYEASLCLPHRLQVVHYKRGSVATWMPLPPTLDWLIPAVVIG